MPLQDYQTALGRLIRARDYDGAAEQQLQGLHLDDDERCAVASLVGGRGLRFTREVQRSWCKGRARNAAYLTLSLLDEERRQNLLDEWVSMGGGIASFFNVEANGFLEFIAARLPQRSHELSICRMEQAVHKANAASANDAGQQPNELQVAHELQANTLLCRAPCASLVDFFAEPNLLLAAIHTNSDLPALEARAIPCFFGPGLPGMFQLADAVETQLWRRLHKPAVMGRLELEGYAASVLDRLISLGIVCPVQSRH